MQRGKQRAGFHLKGTLGDLLDAVRNRKSVHFAEVQGFENQEIESSLQKIRCRHSRIEILYEQL